MPAEETLFSIVVPVYNRPQELEELLRSLAHQSSHRFEVIVVEDGSTLRGEELCRREWGFPVHYMEQENQGPARARNTGVGSPYCRSPWVLFFDSDCILPPNYILTCEDLLQDYPEVSLFGGPDAAAPGFNHWQKCVSYAMTSPFSTGGIRGGGEGADKFYPRTFNMGVRRSAFTEVGGFADMRYGEDVDLSMRLCEAGGKSMLFKELFVYHKRRGNFRAFFRQIEHSGRARIELRKRHPGTLRLVHMLPAVGVVLLIVAATCVYLPLTVGVLALGLLYGLIILLHALIRTRNMHVALLAVPACATMLMGYGVGLLVGLLGLERTPPAQGE